MALEENNTLEAYISFLPNKGRELIYTSREQDSEPLSILNPFVSKMIFL